MVLPIVCHPLAVVFLIFLSALADSANVRARRSFGENIRKFFRLFKSASCPRDNELLRYDETTRQCHEAGSRGPCGRNMIFYTKRDNERLGTCDCAYAHESRTLIYHQPTNQCYFVFQQGYCVYGQWLTFNPRNNKPVCQTNPCMRFGSSRSIVETLVQFQGSCVPLNSPCDGEPNGVVKFITGFVLPRCSASSSSSKAVGAPVQGCPPGSHLAYNGKCQPIFEW